MLQDGIIGYGTGEANVNVEFRLIVFRPFKGEIILGDIASSDEEGIKSGPSNLKAYLLNLGLRCSSSLRFLRRHLCARSPYAVK